jgi:hypothetical protein
VARRSVVVTSLRQGCSGNVAAGAACPPAILDMGGLMEAILLDGANTTIVFMGITLRNFFSTLTPSNLPAASADQNSIRAFFIFDRFVHAHARARGATFERRARGSGSCGATRLSHPRPTPKTPATRWLVAPTSPS